MEKLEQEDLLNRIRTKVNVSKFGFGEWQDENSSRDSRVLRIFDDNNEAKMRATVHVIDELVDFEEHASDKKIIHISIYIPDEMVSLIIGQKGRQINKIKSQSKTQISVSNQGNKSEKRKVDISGKRESIKRGVKIIYDLVQTMLARIRQIDTKRPTAQPNRYARVRARLVVSRNMSNYIIGDEGNFAKGLRKEFGVKIKVYQNENIRCVHRGEIILGVAGRLKDVQNALVLIVRRCHEYLSKSTYEKDMIKCLI